MSKYDILMYMENKSVHVDCYYCSGENPFLFSNWLCDAEKISARFTIQKKHQGWPGIPHGGVGITALIELADIFLDSSISYPLFLNFRFGGEQLYIGDEAIAEIIKKGSTLFGKVEKNKKHPYLTCDMSLKTEMDFQKEIELVEKIVSQNPTSESPLVMPNYANKIIFTPNTQHLHKYRTFYFCENPDGRVYVKCMLTDCEGKGDGTDINKLGKHLHPGALITILDEVLGWASFFASWQGGVTINIAAYFPKSVEPGGHLYSIGFCERTWGTIHRKIAYASGGLIKEKDGGNKIVAYAYGRWLTKPEYKEKMLRYISSYSP